mmetsp:Transcript_83999/g.261244  ORF Transcript_83999/g.261244 Transcript_83999/m.261244 type:complete len:216 (-) Transcript_83999:120-767(-)
MAQPLAGATASQEDSKWAHGPGRRQQVWLHVYDIDQVTAWLNEAVLRAANLGAFHCGVEVYGWEWSFRDTMSPDGTGVFCCTPRGSEGHVYREAVPMGKTATSEIEVMQLVAVLEKEWPGRLYDVLTRNCCHFSDEFCQRLGVGAIPTWVMNLAGAGAAVAAAGDTTCCRQVATQVALHTCCPQPPRRAGYMPVEVIDTPKQESRRSRKVAATEA